MQASLNDAFRRVGLQLLTFQIVSITPPEEVQKRIDERSGMGAIGNMQTYMQYQTAQAIGDAANNPGSGGDAASTGVGLGAGIGMGTAMAQAMQGAFNQPHQGQPGQGQQAAAQGIPCTNCGQPVPPGSKFCPNCGTQVATATVTCPKCGTANAPGAKFCTNCGTNLTA
jgi:membrane protease subunit (stomatin/prohibitin family)